MVADRQRKDVAIRRATAADVGSLVAIEEAAFPGDRITRRSFHYQIASETLALLVATVDRVVHGYILLSLRRKAKHARIYSLAVDTEEGRGLGRALMEAGERLAQRRGYRRMRLEVRADNARAIGIYGRAGYEKIGVRESYYEDGANALRFEKVLGGDQPSRRTRSRAKR